MATRGLDRKQWLYFKTKKTLNAKNWAFLYLYYLKLSHARGTLSTPIICENIKYLKTERTSSNLYTSYTMDNEVG